MKKLFLILILFLANLVVFAQENTVFSAAKTNNVIALTALKASGADVNAVDLRGFSPLILAVYNDQFEAVKFLIANGADVNKADKSGNTALMGAVFKGYDSMVAYLIKEGKANVNQVNLNGATALIFAATFGRVDISTQLLVNKADAKLKDNRGKTAKDHALMQEHEPLVKLLEKFDQ